MSNEFIYKIVVAIEFLKGDMEYVLWEPLMYGQMLDNKVDLHKLFFDTPDFITTPPLEVNIYLYHNPQVKEISQGINGESVVRQLLVGKRICLLQTF
jgi:hypothetical protein